MTFMVHDVLSLKGTREDTICVWDPTSRETRKVSIWAIFNFPRQVWREADRGALASGRYLIFFDKYVWREADRQRSLANFSPAFAAVTCCACSMLVMRCALQSR